MVSAKKTKDTFNSKLKLVMKSGKVSIGFTQAIKNLNAGKAKLIIIANNCPPIRRSQIEYYAMLSKANIHHFSGR